MTNSNKLLENRKGYTVYTSGCTKGNADFLKPVGFRSVAKLEDADLILFGGGADVSPDTYGEEIGASTYDSPAREKVERDDFNKAKKLGKKLFGICRGHQLLTALAGGKLIQDVSGHGGNNHKVTTFDGLELSVNSLHHQMINPYWNPKKFKPEEDYKVLGWTPKKLSKRYLGGNDRGVLLPWGFREIEAIYFPKIKGLGVQWHPEMMFIGNGSESPSITWVQNTILKLMNDSL